MKKSLLVIILLLSVLLSACSAMGNAGRSMAKRLEEDLMEHPITEQEKEVLCSAYLYEEQQRAIMDGQLLQSQKELLMQMRAIVQWLEEKYPSHSFEIIEIEQKIPLQQNIYYLFAADGSEKVFSACAQERDSEEYRENFFPVVFQEACVANVSKAIEDCGVDYMAVDVGFLGMAGGAVTEKTSPADIFFVDHQISQSVKIYISGGKEQLDQAIRKLESIGIPGTYFVIASDQFSNEMTAEACAEFKKQNSALCISESFSIKRIQ